MASVSLRNLEKYYGKVYAVKKINAEVKDREFLCLLGPSGCGKSTTLRMIAGLESITSGEIYIGENLVNELAPKDRDIAMVFESYALYPHKNVFQNMAYPLTIRKMPLQEIEERVHKAAKILEITDLLDRGIAQLSGGQKQRVAIGRAIVREPRVFLMDEPISHLDAKLKTHMRGELRHLQRVLNTTMIYVTHDQLEAISMADRIAIMNYGEIQQIGTPDEIFNEPANMFVAGFVGDPPMNFIEGHLHTENEQVVFRNKGVEISLTDQQAQRLSEGDHNASKKMVIGFRPEDIAISKEPIDDAHAQGEIYVTSPVGKDKIIEMEVGEHRIKVITPVDYDIEMGEKAWIEVNRKRMHGFDLQSTDALF